jgi:hypothetical protein
MAALPPVSYLEVGANLPRAESPKGETERRVSIVLFITSTSGNDNRRRGAEPGVYGRRVRDVKPIGRALEVRHSVEEIVVFTGAWERRVPVVRRPKDVGNRGKRAMEPTQRVRPQGVTILAMLATIGGVLGLIAGLFALGIGGAVAASGNGLGGLLGLVGILAIAQGALALVFAYGAWYLKPWGWMLGVAAEVLSLAISAYYVIQGNAAGQVISIVIAIAILYYLFTPAVKAAFGRT